MAAGSGTVYQNNVFPGGNVPGGGSGYAQGKENNGFYVEGFRADVHRFKTQISTEEISSWSLPISETLSVKICSLNLCASA